MEQNTTNKFEIIPALLKEMDEEMATTRKFLALVPFDKLDWRPHPKSMTMQELALHIADLPSWAKLALTTEELDFATAPYEPTEVANNAALMDALESSYAAGKASLSAAKESDLLGPWVLRTGEKIHARMTKYEVIRLALQQTTHHRAQLGVYFRLLDIFVPGSYGPSADDTDF